MKKYFGRIIFIFLSLFLLACTLSCSGKSGSKAEVSVNKISAINEEINSKIVKMISPDENAEFKLHESVKVVLEPATKEKSPDSLKLYFDGKVITTIKTTPWEFTITGNTTTTTGRKSLKVTAFREGKQQNTITRFLIFYSDVVPENYAVKVINSYPHDREAFTQGLVYEGGRFFEGTGQKAGSSLREVELKTGKVIRQQNLDASLFGEGITIFKDRIFQVTWENKVGFVYDMSTFKVINKIYYQTEGWGLTTIDNKIAMSDGTNIISFYEPDTFTAVRKIEVYDNRKKVDQLNELEYINGELWANIWMTDLIVKIDPISGKVLSYIDLKGLLPDKEKEADTDVLNGIAFDKEGGRIFVTGKKWPRLYEIKVVK